VASAHEPGYIVSLSAVALAERGVLGEAAIGALITAVITSLPELVTTLAAIRRGALALAVGGIIGGNTFDTLFLAVADIAYRGGSLYHAISERALMGLAATVLMTAVLVLGLLRRERSGPAGIGFESVSVIGIYGLYAAALVT